MAKYHFLKPNAAPNGTGLHFVHTWIKMTKAKAFFDKSALDKDNCGLCSVLIILKRNNVTLSVPALWYSDACGVSLFTNLNNF